MYRTLDRYAYARNVTIATMGVATHGLVKIKTNMLSPGWSNSRCSSSESESVSPKSSVDSWSVVSVCVYVYVYTYVCMYV